MKRAGFFILPAALLLIITSTIALHLRKATPQRQARSLFLRLKARAQGSWAFGMATHCLCDNGLYAIETKRGKLFLCRQREGKQTLTFAGAEFKGQSFAQLELTVEKKKERRTLAGKKGPREDLYNSLRRGLKKQMKMAQKNYKGLGDVGKRELNKLVPHKLRKKALVRKHLTRAWENLRELYSPPSAAPPSCNGGFGEAPE